MSQKSTTTVASEVTKPAKKMGRPPLYKGNVLKHIVALIRKHNAATAMRILRADAASELGKLRNVVLIPNPLTISQPTLLKFAGAKGVKLSVGRPKLKKAA